MNAFEMNIKILGLDLYQVKIKFHPQLSFLHLCQSRTFSGKIKLSITKFLLDFLVLSCMYLSHAECKAICFQQY